MTNSQQSDSSSQTTLLYTAAEDRAIPQRLPDTGRAGCSESLAENPEKKATDGDSNFEEILEQHTKSLHMLSEGLNRFQQNLMAEVTGAVKTAMAGNGESDVPTSSEPAPKSSPASERGDEPTRQPVLDSDTDGSPVDATWTMIREAMLKSTAEECEQPSLDIAESERSDTSVTQEEVFETLEPVEFTVPDPYDCATIEDDTLRAAFLEREEILRKLSVRLRQRVRPVTTISADQLREIAESLPDDLRERVSQSLTQLDEQLRLTELELSLERARMARQMTRIEETRHILENAADRLGYSIAEDGTLAGAPNSADTRRSGRRWMRVLGFGH